MGRAPCAGQFQSGCQVQTADHITSSPCVPQLVHSTAAHLPGSSSSAWWYRWRAASVRPHSSSSLAHACQAALQSRGSHGCSRTVERCTKRMVNTAWRFGQAKGGRQAREGGAGLCRTTASAHTCSSDAHVQEGLASVQRRNRERASSMSPRLHERSRIGHFRIQRLQAG